MICEAHSGEAEGFHDKVSASADKNLALCGTWGIELTLILAIEKRPVAEFGMGAATRKGGIIHGAKHKAIFIVERAAVATVAAIVTVGRGEEIQVGVMTIFFLLRAGTRTKLVSDSIDVDIGRGRVLSVEMTTCFEAIFEASVAHGIGGTK